MSSITSTEATAHKREPWFKWFTRNSFNLESIDFRAESKKVFEPMYPLNRGYNGRLENLPIRLSTLSQLKAWNLLPESDPKKSVMRPLSKDLLDEFVQWFLFRKDSTEWFEDFVEHSNTLEGWFDACETSLPHKSDICKEIIAPKGYFFFNPYKNTGLSQIADQYIAPFFDPIYRSQCSSEQKSKLIKAQTLLEREDSKGRTTHRGIGTMIMIEAGLGRLDKLIPLAQKSQSLFGNNNYNFIAAGNLLLLHGKEEEGHQAYEKQDIDSLEGQRLAFLGLFAFLWDDPRLFQIWSRIEDRVTSDHLENASIGFVAILSFSAKKLGLTNSSESLWNYAIAKKPRIKSLVSVASRFPYSVSINTSFSSLINRWIKQIESNIRSEA